MEADDVATATYISQQKRLADEAMVLINEKRRINNARKRELLEHEGLANQKLAAETHTAELLRLDTALSTRAINVAEHKKELETLKAQFLKGGSKKAKHTPIIGTPASSNDTEETKANNAAYFNYFASALLNTMYENQLIMPMPPPNPKADEPPNNIKGIACANLYDCYVQFGKHFATNAQGTTLSTTRVITDIAPFPPVKRLDELMLKLPAATFTLMDAPAFIEKFKETFSYLLRFREKSRKKHHIQSVWFDPERLKAHLIKQALFYDDTVRLGHATIGYETPDAPTKK